MDEEVESPACLKPEPKENLENDNLKARSELESVVDDPKVHSEPELVVDDPKARFELEPELDNSKARSKLESMVDDPKARFEPELEVDDPKASPELGPEVDDLLKASLDSKDIGPKARPQSVPEDSESKSHPDDSKIDVSKTPRLEMGKVNDQKPRWELKASDTRARMESDIDTKFRQDEKMDRKKRVRLTKELRPAYPKRDGNFASPYKREPNKDKSADGKISTTLKRLFREDDFDNFSQLCEQLQELFCMPENELFMRKAMLFICNSLADTLYETKPPLRQLVADSLAKFAVLLKREAKSFFEWIFTKYSKEKSKNDASLSLLETILKILKIDTGHALGFYSRFLMSKMQYLLENTETSEETFLCVEIIIRLFQEYPNDFSNCFKDLVDILIGWIIDTSQPRFVTKIMLDCLKRVRTYWLGDATHTMSLMGQLVEDAQNFAGDFLQGYDDDDDEDNDGEGSNTNKNKKKCLEALGKSLAFLKVFNCMTRSTMEAWEDGSNWSVFLDWLLRTTNAVLIPCLKTGRMTEEILTTGNETVWLMTRILRSKICSVQDYLYELLRLELELLPECGNNGVVSSLRLASKIIREGGANLPEHMIEALIGGGEEGEGTAKKFRYSRDGDIQTAVLAVYHSLLNLKNIPLLQKVYRLVLIDMEKAFEILEQKNGDVSAAEKEEAEMEFLFYLRAISQLANEGGSIISMWILRPCILQVLAETFNPVGRNLTFPVRYSLLQLLHSHCSRYSNFVSNSSLVAPPNIKLRNVVAEISTVSPTSGHLTIILNLLSQLMYMKLPFECGVLCWKWCSNLLSNCEKFACSLLSTTEFWDFIEAVLYNGCACRNTRMLPFIFDALFIFIANGNVLAAKPELSRSIVEFCLIHLDCQDDVVRKKSVELMTLIPWNAAISTIGTISRRFNTSFEKAFAVNRRHMNRGSGVEMRYHHFKLFSQYILEGTEEDVKTFLESFYNSWNGDRNDFCEAVPYFQTSLYFWMSWESARYCVNNRLRTHLGKAQDTLIAIEGRLKALAKDAENGEEEFRAFDLVRTRLLLDFVEQLEKCIHNAAEGTSFALLQPSASIRKFFRTNKTTCLDWISRVYAPVASLSHRSGYSALAVRYAYRLLADLSENKKKEKVSSELDKTIALVGKALCDLNEPEAIIGLREWSKSAFPGRDYSYLRALSLQADKKYEMAIDTYLGDDDEHFGRNETIEEKLQSEVARSSSNESSERTNFVYAQIAECYLHLNHWNELGEFVAWLERNGEADSFALGISQYGRCVVPNEAEFYERIDKGGDFETLTAEKDTTTATWMDGKCAAWNDWGVMRAAKAKMATNIIRDFSAPEKGILSHYLNENSSLFEKNLSSDLRSVSTVTVYEYATLLYAGAKFPSSVERWDDDKVKVEKLGSKLLKEASRWMNIVETCENAKRHAGVLGRFHNDKLRLKLVKAGRKEGNVKSSSYHLVRHFQKNCFPRDSTRGTDLREMLSKNFPTRARLVKLIKYSTEVNVWTVDNADALLELSKLVRCEKNEELAVEVCATMALSMCQASIVNPSLRDKTSQIFMKLAKWLSGDVKSSDENIPYASCVTIEKLKAAFEGNVAGESPIAQIMNYDFEEGIPPKDSSVGGLLRASAVQSPTCAKAWYQLGNWCYTWGGGSHFVCTDADTWCQRDKEVLEACAVRCPNEDALYAILTGCLKQRPSCEYDAEMEMDCVGSAESVRRELDGMKCFNGEEVEALIDVWRKMKGRMFSFYKLSAYSYFRYLQLGQNRKNEAVVSCTLRLLRLMTKYAIELQTTLEVELEITPTTPWKCIIPQLFSRLNHTEPYVRERVSDLLCRVAEDAPHLITFPAVVGANFAATETIKEMPSSKLFEKGGHHHQGEEEGSLEAMDEEDVENEEECDEDASGGEGGKCQLENCYVSLVDTLTKQSPDTIARVGLLVRELRRITLLWDELWLGALGQHHNDMARRISQLEAEISRVDSNPDFTEVEKNFFVAQKYDVMVKPLLFILEQLRDITAVEPETPHERWFQQTFKGEIGKALTNLHHPADVRDTKTAWTVIKDLYHQFQQKVAKRGLLSMKNISPALAEFSNSGVAMPGVESRVTIASIHDRVQILPTKTKPKKLSFLGSDGKMYTYLFKGLEDLHLDERIMQLLSITNTMLRGLGEEGEYKARHYSVTPLGPRSGLISWVDGVTPIFSVYRKWQQREAAAADKPVVTRPTDLFYAKLQASLKERGLGNVESLGRKDWPSSVLQQVLLSLMEETPRDLLEKELWCNSANAGAWWKITRAYAISSAVMSVIGYIIGLGDRHLDNVLVELHTGEVVHIDYNVCFDKGKTLRIPENVPFRMTPNLKAALGVCGVEGIFRLTCEKVLRVMKGGKEALLTLLEAFVYDPLLDWKPGTEIGYTGAVYSDGRDLTRVKNRKKIEEDVSTAMLAIRLAETKVSWFENKKRMEEALVEVTTRLEMWREGQESLKGAKERLGLCSWQLVLIKEATANPQHPLYTLYERYERDKGAVAASMSAEMEARMVLDQRRDVAERYRAFLRIMKENDGEQWQWAAAATGAVSEGAKLFERVEDILRSMGLGQFAEQCLILQERMNATRRQLCVLADDCVKLLKTYYGVIRSFPVSSFASNRNFAFEGWLLYILEKPARDGNFSACRTRCEKVLEEFHAAFGDEERRKERGICAGKFADTLREEIRAVEKSMKGESVGDGTTVTSATTTTIEGREGDALAERLEKDILELREDMPETTMCAIVGKLLEAVKASSKLELTARAAGDSLATFKTSDGGWFLSEMADLADATIKLTTYALDVSILNADGDLRLAATCLDTVAAIYKYSQNVYENFVNIFIPEVIHELLREDGALVGVIEKLDAFRVATNDDNDDDHNEAQTGFSLPEILTRLQSHLSSVIMGMPSSHEKLFATMEGIWGVSGEFNVNFIRRGEEWSSTFGKMTEVFGHLLGNTAKLFALLPKLNEAVSALNDVDFMEEARSITGPVFRVDAQRVLLVIQRVKCLQMMREMLKKCRNDTEALFSSPTRRRCAYPKGDVYGKYVKSFLAEFLSENALGLFSYATTAVVCLLLKRAGCVVVGKCGNGGDDEGSATATAAAVSFEKVCLGMVDRHREAGDLTPCGLAHATSMLEDLRAAWKRAESLARMERIRRAAAEKLRNLTEEAVAYTWLHEDLLPPPPIVKFATKGEILQQLSQACHSLAQVSEHFIRVEIPKFEAAVANIVPRLNWACGSNTASQSVKWEFDRSAECVKNAASAETTASNALILVCHSVLSFEKLRATSPECSALDGDFARVVNNYKNGATGLGKAAAESPVTSEEEFLIQLLTPDRPVDAAWIGELDRIVSETMQNLSRELEPRKQACAALLEKVNEAGDALRKAALEHKKIFEDVYPLLKSAAKYEANDRGDGGGGGPHRMANYLHFHKRFYQDLAANVKILTTVTNGDQNEGALVQAQAALTSSMALTTCLFETLYTLQSGGNCELEKLANVEKAEENTPLNRSFKVQEKNAYAMNVWREVRKKLDGRAKDDGATMSVPEQIDFIIKEATNLQNLAQLYEGWTPWV